LFINDLPQGLQEAKVVLFAGDTNILFTEKNITSLNDKIQIVRKKLDNWFYENHLILNTDKTKALFFQGRGPSPIHRPIFCLNNEAITYTSNIKFLGICITENLSWATRIQYLCQKLNMALYLIKSLRDAVSLSILRNVYLTKFESILKYGIIFWGRCPRTLILYSKHQKKKKSKID
jgi:hypothetical protein